MYLKQDIVGGGSMLSRADLVGFTDEQVIAAKDDQALCATMSNALRMAANALATRLPASERAQ